MMLSDVQTDALKELLNIGFARTAAALAQLADHRIELDSPDVVIRPIALLGSYLDAFFGQELATVHQLFSGAFEGDAILLLNSGDAARLTELLTERRSSSPLLDASAREVLTEVGNIMLNACLGMFGNLLQVHITFAVPHLQVSSLDKLLVSLSIGQQELTHALVAHTRFSLREEMVTGSLMIVLGVTSFEHLIGAVDDWVRRAEPVAAENGSRKEDAGGGHAAEPLRGPAPVT